MTLRTKPRSYRRLRDKPQRYYQLRDIIRDADSVVASIRDTSTYGKRAVSAAIEACFAVGFALVTADGQVVLRPTWGMA